MNIKGYSLGNIANTQENKQEKNNNEKENTEMTQENTTIMTGLNVYEKAFDEIIKREGAKELFDWLKGTDFFEAPASTNFHSNFKGGLAAHSIQVYKNLRKIMGTEWMKEMLGCEASEETLAIVALLHDVCKVNNYTFKESARKYKDDTLKNEKGYPGVWLDLPGYVVNENTLPGHGELSVFMISQYMSLTLEESFAIRYHMGLYEGENKMREVSNVFGTYPLAFALHLADDMASKYCEKTLTQDDKIQLEREKYLSKKKR